jgi:hypothetical protein
MHPAAGLIERVEHANAHPLSCPDGDIAASWAAERGYGFKLTPHPFADRGDGPARALLTSGAEPWRWNYSGSGTPTKAVHEAMTYAVRDRGFDGEFVEACGSDFCPFCTDRPFPSDGERVTP